MVTELDLHDLVRPLPEDRARVEALTFDATGRWLAAVAFGVLVVYDLSDVTRHAEVPLPPGRGVRSLAFSATGRHVVLALTREARPDDPSALVVVDLPSSTIVRTLPEKGHRELVRDLGSQRESLTAWALSPDGATLASAWGRVGVVTFPLDGSGYERIPAPCSTEGVPAELLAITFAGTSLVCQFTEGLALRTRTDEAWRTLATDTLGRGLLAAMGDGSRVVLAGHAPRRLGQLARSGAWIVHLTDGTVTFDGIRADGMAPIGLSHDGWRVWWTRPVERFATRLTPLSLHVHDVAAGAFTLRLTDARKAPSTCAAIDASGRCVAFGRLRSIGLREPSP